MSQKELQPLDKLDGYVNIIWSSESSSTLFSSLIRYVFSKYKNISLIFLIYKQN